MRGTLYCLYGVYTSKRKRAAVPKLQLLYTAFCWMPACAVHEVLRFALFSGFSAGWNVICYKLETRQVVADVSSLSP